MAHLDTHLASDTLDHVRRQARHSSHVQRAHIMLVAAGLAAFAIVAVAGAMMTTLF